MPASSGVPLQSAVSAGIAAIGEWHGGAIEQAAKILQEGVSYPNQNKLSLEDVGARLLQDYADRHEKVPGYGHPTHTVTHALRNC